MIVVVPESTTASGGNVTVSVPDPNVPAGMGSLVSVVDGCVKGWLRPLIWPLIVAAAVMTVDELVLKFCDVTLL